MKTIVILFCLILSLSKAQNLNRVPLTILLNSWSQSQEDSIKATLNSSIKFYHIWNTTLATVRIFDGTNFNNIPIIPNILTGAASITSDINSVNTTETIIVKTSSLSANRLLPGTTLRATLFGINTSTASVRNTFAVRIGTTGTISDGVMISDNSLFSATTGTAIPFKVIFEITIRTVGINATSNGSITLLNTGITGIMSSSTGNIIIIPTFTNFNTTISGNIISFTYKSASIGTTSSFQNAQIEIVYK